MIYKILIGTCLLILSACDTKNLDESTHTKSVEKKKIDKISSVFSKPKPLKISEDIIRTLDNKVYILVYVFISIGLISSEFKFISAIYAIIMMLCLYSYQIFISAISIQNIKKLKKFIFQVSLVIFLFGFLFTLIARPLI